MRLSPAAAKSYVTLSRIYLGLGRQKAALAILEEGIEQNPSAPAIHIQMGDIHKSASRHNDALRAYTKTVAVDPDFWTGHYKRGVALYYLSRLDESKVALNKADDLNPSSSSVKHFKGLVALANNETDEALSFLTEAAQRDRENPDILFHLGQAHQRESQWAEAEAQFGAAYRLNPRKSEVLYGLSQVSAKLGRRDKAREYSRRFKTISQFEQERDVLMKQLWGKPTSIELRRDLAYLLEKNGAYSEAIEQLRLAAYLGDESAVEELERLEIQTVIRGK